MSRPAQAPADRRTFLTGSLALASAVAATAYRAEASEVGPIEAAYPEYVRLMTAWDAACEVTWAAEERYEEPSQPIWQPWSCEGGYKVVRLPHGKRICCLVDGPENVEYLEALAGSSYVPNEDGRFTDERHHRVRAEAARKTLDRLLSWQTECRQRKDAAGLTVAQEAEDTIRTTALAHADGSVCGRSKKLS